MRHFRRLALLPVPVALTVACGPAMAVSTWVGGAAPNPSSMNNPANWTGGTPVSGAPNLSLVFPSGTAFSTVQQDLANPLILQSLTIERIYAFSGNGFRFSNLGANPTFHTTSTFTLDAPVEFAAPTTISGANRLQLGGTLTGSADVMMSGTGFRDVLINGTGTNPYSGTITVSGSNNRLFLAQSGGHATSGSFIVDNGARLHVNTGNQFAANSDLTVLNAAEFHSDGRLGAQDRVRNLTVSGGVVGIYSSLVVTGNISSAGGSSEIYGGSLDLDGNETIIKVTGTGATDVLHLGSTITNGRFEKTGAGILSLSSDSPSYNGVNKITAGTLRTNAHAMGTVVNNATLELWGGNLDTDQISGSGSVRLTGNVWYNAAQTYTGTTNLANFGSASGSVATLLGNFHGEAGAFNAQVIFVQPADGVFTGTLTGDVGVQQHGEGTLTLNGGNTYTQGTKLANGVLRVTSDSSLGSGTGALTFGGGVFAAVGTRTFANPLIFSEVAAVVGDGNVTFTDTNTKTVYSTLIHASSGSTTINGKMAAGASGNLVVTGGHLTVGSPAHVGGFVSQGPIYVTSGATLTLRSLNFVTLPEVTLAGGTLRAPNGYAIPTGAALQGSVTKLRLRRVRVAPEVT
jgi:fibronectin-binding autotransporter adhesin